MKKMGPPPSAMGGSLGDPDDGLEGTGMGSVATPGQGIPPAPRPAKPHLPHPSGGRLRANKKLAKPSVAAPKIAAAKSIEALKAGVKDRMNELDDPNC